MYRIVYFLPRLCLPEGFQRYWGLTRALSVRLRIMRYVREIIPSILILYYILIFGDTWTMTMETVLAVYITYSSCMYVSMFIYVKVIIVITSVASCHPYFVQISYKYQNYMGLLKLL